jgi:hypothetical protein
MLILNGPSGFSVGQCVIVKRGQERHSGTIYHVEMAPVNSGIENGDKTDHLYVTLNAAVYQKLLLRGSPVMVNDTRYIVDQIIGDKVVLYLAGPIVLYPTLHTVFISQLSAMLIWLQAYEMIVFS